MGYEVTIIPGAKIGDGAVIGAKAVVTKEVAIYVIVGDNPTREIRKRRETAKAMTKPVRLTRLP